MKGKLTNYISILLCMAILNFYIADNAAFSVEAASDTLLPEMRTSPIVNPDVAKKNVLESYIIYKLKENPELLFQRGVKENRKNLISKRRDKTIELLFTEEEVYTVSNLKEVTISEKIRIIPCLLNQERFYVFLTGENIKRVQVYVYTTEEYAVFKSKAQEKVKEITAEDLEGIDHVLPLERTDIRVVDTQDETVMTVSEFLINIGLDSLGEEVEQLVEENSVYAAAGVSLIPNRIVLDTNKDRRHSAWSFLGQILLKKDPNLSFSLLERFGQAYNYFYDNKDSFDLDDIDPGLNLFIYNLEKGASNEGGIALDGAAYLSIINTDNVPEEYFEEAKNDIMEVFKEVIDDELRKADDENEKVVHLTRSFPITEERIVVGYLSDSVIPTVVTRKDGVVIINKNFVNVMAFLIQKGFRSETGSIFIDKENVGNLYYSMLYGIAIKSIRGHFKGDNGRYLFIADESLAQGERGGNNAYINILSMMYFWFAVAEGGYLLETARVEHFIKEHPDLFEKLTLEQKERLPGDLMKFSNAAINTRKLERVAIPVPWFVFERIYSNKNGVTYDQLEQWIGALGARGAGPLAHPERLRTSLDLLLDLKVISRYREGREIIYKAATLTGKQAENIRNLLYEHMKNRSQEDVEVLRTRIFKETDSVWAKAFKAKVKDVRNNGKTDADGKLVIAIETDWIPEAQMAFMQELIKEVTKRGDNRTIDIIRASKNDLYTKISEKIEKENISLKDVLIFAGEQTLEMDAFKDIIAQTDEDQDKAFAIGVDSEQLKGDSYIRLMEMLNMALRMFTGSRFLADHPAINIIKKNQRYFLFIPSAEKIKLSMIKKVYDIQCNVLRSL